LLAFSGGLDSTVLLYLFAQALKNEPGVTLSAIHVHHGLQAEADDWVLHCQRVCDHWQVPLTVISVNAQPNAGESPEEAARKARYQALESAMTSQTILVTGHHQDDQAETVLLQLLRGSGAKGLCAMAEWKALTRGWHYRPLLTYSRPELEQVAQHQGLTWIEDPSNASLHYARNALRHTILPLLSQFWPGYRKTLTRSARLLAESDDLLSQFAHEQLIQLGATRNHLPLIDLPAFTPARQALLLRTWLSAFNQSYPSEIQLTQFLGTLLTAKADRHPSLVWGKVVLYRYKHNLHWRPRITHSHKTPLPWRQFPHPLVLDVDHTLVALPSPNTGLRTLSPDEINTLSIRYWQASEGSEGNHSRPQGSDRFHPADRRHSQTIKKLLQEWHIPMALKREIPFLYCGDTLIAIVGYAVAKTWQVTADGWHIGDVGVGGQD